MFISYYTYALRTKIMPKERIYLKMFAEFGRRATFGFTEKAVKMAESIKPAGETNFRDRHLCGH